MIRKLIAFIVVLLMAMPIFAWGQKPEATPVTGKPGHKTSNAVQLTPKEKAWIKGHSTIRVGMSPVFPPLKFLENGVIKGIEPDYLQLLSEYTGIKFEYVVCDFSVMDGKVKSGEIDMFISFYIPERLSYMAFTETMMDFKQVIVARKDAPFMSGLGTLKGKRIAIVKGVRLHEKLLAPYPDIQAVPVDTMEDMFKAVSDFKADALISRTYYAGYEMNKYPDLKIAGVLNLPPEPYLYAVRKDYPELVGILNKAIAAIPRETLDAIVQKWFSVRLEYRPDWSEIVKWVLAVVGVFIIILGMSLFWNRRLAREIKVRKRAEEERERLIEELQAALSKVKLLDGLLPICAACKRIRNDEGHWEQMEIYIRERSEANFSHGICPECAERLYPDFYKKK